MKLEINAMYDLLLYKNNHWVLSCPDRKGCLQLSETAYPLLRKLDRDKKYRFYQWEVEEVKPIPARGTRVVVWNDPLQTMRRAYSTGEMQGGKLLCVPNGQDEWTYDESTLVGWSFWGEDK